MEEIVGVVAVEPTGTRFGYVCFGRVLGSQEAVLAAVKAVLPDRLQSAQLELSTLAYLRSAPYLLEGVCVLGPLSAREQRRTWWWRRRRRHGAYSGQEVYFVGELDSELGSLGTSAEM